MGDHDDECIHGLTPLTCSVCKHGPTPRASERPSTANCRSCEAEVIWVETEKGKRMPIDADPSPDGRFELVDGHHVRFVRPGSMAPGDLYSSHFESCPDSRDWKRSR